MNIIRIEETASTNTRLIEMASSGPLEEGTVLLTREQTSGRGQAGNYWESEPGKNLTFSMLLNPDFLNLRQHFLLSEMVSNSIRQVLDQYIDQVTIKWPNDIYFRNKKMAGILIENSILSERITQSVIGIGLNVNQEQFRSDAPNPVSLEQILGSETDPDLLLEALINQLKLNYEKLKAGKTDEIRQFYHDSLYRRNGYHLFSDATGEFLAEINSVADDGVLYLKTRSGEIKPYLFKEVAFVF